jgi:hypothetical protein
MVVGAIVEGYRKEKLTRTAKLSEEDSTDVDVGVTA